MIVVDDLKLEEVLCLTLTQGEDFYRSIQKVAEKKDVHEGIVLSGIATFDEARIHYIVDTDVPAENEFVTWEGPIELSSVDGIIADYEPHMHCTLSTEGGRILSGHLEPGCRVQCLAEVAIAKLSGPSLTRRKDSEYPLPLLRRSEK